MTATLEPAGFSDGYYKLLGVMNVLTTVLNAVNCSSSLNCSHINRFNCGAVMHTCGSCKPGYVGTVGDSNYPCIPYQDSVKQQLSLNRKLSITDDNSEVSDLNSCDQSSCRFGTCQNNKCVPLHRQCPSNSLNNVCSGNGECQAIDLAGKHLPYCGDMDQGCEVLCVCDSYHGGRDCSLTLEQLYIRERARTMMCQALEKITLYHNPTFNVVYQISTTLYQVRTVASSVFLLYFMFWF